MLFLGSNYIWIGYDSSDIIFPQLNCSSGAKLAFGRQLIYSKRSGFFFFFAGWFGCSNGFSCAARASWFFHFARLSLLGERVDTDRRRRRRYHIEDLKLATATFSPLQPLPFLGPEPHLHRVVHTIRRKHMILLPLPSRLDFTPRCNIIIYVM